MSRNRHARVAALFVLLGWTLGPASSAHGEDEPLRPELQSRVDALAAEEVETRREAAYALWNLGHKAQFALPALADALRDPDPYVRSTAGRVLALFDWQKVPAALNPIVPQLIQALDDPRVEVRREAAGLLWRVGPTMSETPAGLLDALKRALASDDATLRARAASAAANLSVRAKPLAPLLGTLLKDEDINVRLWAAQAVGAIDPRGQLKPLMGAFTDSAGTVRTAALSAISGLGAGVPGVPADVPAGFMAALEHALRDRVPGVRAAAANAFWALTLRDGVPALTRVLLEDPDDAVRAAAAMALGGLGSAQALPALSACTLNQNPRIRGSAAMALGQLGPEGAAALPLLRRLARDADLGVRGNALMGISSLGVFAAPAQDVIIDGLAHEDIGVRQFAMQALLRLTLAGVSNPEIESTVRSALLDSFAGIRSYARQAAQALGAAGHPFIPLLVKQLADAKGTDIQSIASTLGSMGPAAREALEPLKAVQSEDPFQQAAVQAAIARIAPGSPEAKLALAMLTELLADKSRRSVALMWLGEIGLSAAPAAPQVEALLDDRILRAMAAQTLLRIVEPPPENAVFVLMISLDQARTGFMSLTFAAAGSRLGALAPLLLPYLEAPSPHLRQQVADSLGTLGNADERIVKALEQAVRDPAAAVRLAAATALRRLGSDR